MQKILGLLSSFGFRDADRNFQGPHLGACVATMELQENLLKHGGFDCCHFFEGRRNHSDEDIAKYIDSQGLESNRILIFDGPLPLRRLKENEYHALYRPDLALPNILALRRAVANPLAPAVVTNHTMSYASMMSTWMELLLSHVLPCDVIMCTSTASQGVIEKGLGLIADRLSAHLGVTIPPFRGRLEVVPLGVDVEYWRPEDDKVTAKKSLELPEHSCVILCPGRFSTHDKMDLRPFLLAVHRVLEIVGPNCLKVVLVGDERSGNESELIQKYVDSAGLTQAVRVDNDGNPSRIRKYHGAADVFVSLADSIQETFGLTVIEAMACGLPTVVSDWNGYKDTVVHCETGYRVPTYWAECDSGISSLAQQRTWTTNHLLLAQSVSVDLDEMVTILHRLVVDPKLRSRWGHSARKRAEELYAWPRVIKRYCAVMDECRERFREIDTQEWLKQDRASILAPEYFRQFSHYPSQIIAPKTKLALACADVEFALGPDSTSQVFLPPVMQGVFHPKVFQALMSRLSEWPVTFGAVVAEVSKEIELSPDLVARQLMWLMKYGVVRPVPSVREFIEETIEGTSELPGRVMA